MAPIEYIPILQAYYKSLGRTDNLNALYQPAGEPPWTQLGKPLRECRVALIGSLGLSCRTQPAFRRYSHDDLSIREIPTDTSPEELVINYDYYDHSGAGDDVNCIFPLARLQDLVEEGFLAGLCPVAFAMGIGRWRDPATPERLQDEVAENLTQRCKAQGADAVLLVPG